MVAPFRNEAPAMAAQDYYGRFSSAYGVSDIVMNVEVCSEGAIGGQNEAATQPQTYTGQFFGNPATLQATSIPKGSGTSYNFPVNLHWKGTCYSGFATFLVAFADLPQLQHLGVGVVMNVDGPYPSCAVQLTEFSLNPAIATNKSSLCYPTFYEARSTAKVYYKDMGSPTGVQVYYDGSLQTTGLPAKIISPPTAPRPSYGFKQPSNPAVPLYGASLEQTVAEAIVGDYCGYYVNENIVPLPNYTVWDGEWKKDYALNNNDSWTSAPSAPDSPLSAYFPRGSVIFHDNENVNAIVGNPNYNPGAVTLDDKNYYFFLYYDPQAQSFFFMGQLLGGTLTSASYASSSPSSQNYLNPTFTTGGSVPGGYLASGVSLINYAWPSYFAPNITLYYYFNGPRPNGLSDVITTLYTIIGTLTYSEFMAKGGNPANWPAGVDSVPIIDDKSPILTIVPQQSPTIGERLINLIESGSAILQWVYKGGIPIESLVSPQSTYVPSAYYATSPFYQSLGAFVYNQMTMKPAGYSLYVNRLSPSAPIVPIKEIA